LAIFFRMTGRDGIVAHIIIGAKPETYLACMLESIADVCGHAVVNDTSGESPSTNRPDVEQSRFARENRLTYIHTTFADFASARNACIDATPASFARSWGLIVDADEVHGPALSSMAALLPRLPQSVDAVDAYLRHFVGSFSWWFELGRTRCLFRLDEERRWQEKIHERLSPVRHRIALPVVWFHYGHVITPREEAEKGQLYASLGQPDPAPTQLQVERASAARVWPGLLRKASRFTGPHPSAAASTISALSRERAALFAEVEALAANQSLVQRLRNAARTLNYQRLLGWRSFEAAMRWGWNGSGTKLGTVKIRKGAILQ
jgi:hypothetical protein